MQTYKIKLILAIENSCDDTAICLWDNVNCKLILEKKASQILYHAKFGGVVPEIASRAHIENLPLIYQKLLAESKVNQADIDLIAVTSMPGLIGSLLIGTSFAQSLSWSLSIPLLAIDHLEAHIYSIDIDNTTKIKYPFISLLVSGGHSHIYYVSGFRKIKLIGKTLDDACGEAFDKVARMIGLMYPGGAFIEKLAKLETNKNLKNIFPIPLKNTKSINLSFSGLKTAVKYKLKELKLNPKDDKLRNFKDFLLDNSKDYIKQTAMIAKMFQNSALTHLIDRIEIACKKYNCNRVSICGGVSANQQMLSYLQNLSKKINLEIYFPKLAYTTDNAAMIANIASKIVNNLTKINDDKFTINPQSVSPLSVYDD